MLIGRLRAANVRGLAWASLALGMLLPGCPLTDNYYIDGSLGSAGRTLESGGSSELGGTGGTLPAAGADDGSGGVPSGDGTGGDTPEGSGGTTGTGGDIAVSGAGGTAGQVGLAGTAGDASATGGTTAGGTSAGTGGTAANGGAGATGGAPTGGRGAGGRSAGGRAAGGAGFAGGTGVAGMGVAGGAGNTQYQPLCDDTIVKGAACDNSSIRFCYRTCGPNNIGYKSETCERGAYVEQSGCDFPSSEDYSCYSVPPSLPAECPRPMVPQATEPCQVSACTVCFGGMPDNPQYKDSTGTQKAGYCVCSDQGAWTCASTTSWPCPDGNGCN